ncbi:hypothetical protein PV08_03598 [Exophiala spinifera]|uniref:Zn(2)-C6 fungal-type domain-containing protein n=1 Tax=Exophiala spinifera TaxID=91928 RepID=A0A0D2C6U7_9EURO|nr:uncharacterized protein PV08_03598 [Exophiala spinifera]KIW19304.1 hypothetical protein PV08_03598 [Exophiala spinifera]
MDTPPSKRKSSFGSDGPVLFSKRIKPLREEPAHYSDAVRKKLTSTSRTGQACDRCKERKMKCDTDPIACGPCRQKLLRCYTTDRVTKQARERGETDRAENELLFLRDQLAAYQLKYGPLQSSDLNVSLTETPTLKEKIPVHSSASLPDAHYVGWPAPDHCEPMRSGPVQGTVVDVLDGQIDIADWECEMMKDYPKDTMNRFNLSATSIINTICGYQRIEDPRPPPKEQALRDANHFLVIMAQYVPIVHQSSFMDLVHRFFDVPEFLTPAERVQVYMLFAIITHQTAVRNHLHSADRFEESHRYFHVALGHDRDLFHDRSLASMQALAMICVHLRNLPKPGISWVYCHKILVRAIELEYHRDPDKIRLPEAERDPLSKQLRIRVFHVILGICVTTGCRVGLPAPWHFQHMDVPLPRAIKDSEISRHGVAAQLSGLCDFWPCLHLAKLLPLLTELHNNIVAVRKPAAEYLQTVEALNTKILAWRQDWEDTIKFEAKQVNLHVAGLLIETWAAEYQLNLFHPVCCTSDDPEVHERHLDICHKAARRLLQAFHTLSSRYKGVDFTWHSTLAYATGFGITLFVYRRKTTPVTSEQFEAMRNELKGWISLMAYADLVLRTGNHLQRQFQPRVQSLEDQYRQLVFDDKASVTPLPFNAVNGSYGPQFKHPKPESETLFSYLDPHATPVQQKNSLPQPQFTQNQIPAGVPQQWPSPFSILPQPIAPSQISPPLFSTFSQSSNAALTTAPLQTVPTSLASLLNDSSSMYVSYPTPPQSQNGLNGDSYMSFQPSHYFDGPGPLTWPLISMPPTTRS